MGCLKCFKASSKGDGEFAAHGEGVQLVGIFGCGDCPGLVMPKTQLVMEVADYHEIDVDVIHLGTCMVKANKTASCPIDLDKAAEMIKNKFGLPVIIGTHNY